LLEQKVLISASVPGSCDPKSLARKAEDYEAAILVLPVKRLETLVLAGVAALRRHVDEEEDFAVVILEGCILSVDVLERDGLRSAAAEVMAKARRGAMVRKKERTAYSAVLSGSGTIPKRLLRGACASAGLLASHGSNMSNITADRRIEDDWYTGRPIPDNVFWERGRVPRDGG
jgi:hypothetical protein